MWIISSVSNCVVKIIPHQKHLNWQRNACIKACVDKLVALHNIFLFIFLGHQNATQPVGSHGYHTLTYTQRNTLFEKLLYVSEWTGSEVAFKKKMNRKSQDLPRIFQEVPLLRELPGPSPSSMRPFLGPFPSPWGGLHSWAPVGVHVCHLRNVLQHMYVHMKRG